MPKLHHPDDPKHVIEPDAEQVPLYVSQGWVEKAKPSEK